MKRFWQKHGIELGIVLCVLSLLVIYGVPKFLRAQNINTERHFPDPNFRNAVENYMGVPPGESFSALEAADKTEDFILNAPNYPQSAFPSRLLGLPLQQQKKEMNQFLKSKQAGFILAVTGLKYFTNIEHFECQDHLIQHLKMPELPNLRYLDVSNSHIQHLDLSTLPNLESLICSNNPLATLDLSHNPNLRVLRAEKCGLQELDVSPCKNLETLYCGYNPLFNIDLSQNAELTYLAIQRAGLTELDLNNKKLRSLDASDNKLGTINLSHLNELQYVNLSSNRFTEFVNLTPHLLFDRLYISNNYLNCDDLDDILAFIKKIETIPPRRIIKREIVRYQDQKRHDLSNCEGHS